MYFLMYAPYEYLSRRCAVRRTRRGGKRRGVSRAELIRRLLDRALVGPDDDPSSDLAAIRETAGALRDVPDDDFPARADGAREERLQRVWRRT